MAITVNGKELPVVRLSGAPGGGSVAYAPAGAHKAGERVTLCSASKGERAGTLTAHLGVWVTPLMGAVDAFQYKADK